MRFAHFEVAEQESVVIVGPSGCGKTTLLKLLAGILLPFEGNLSVCGENLPELPFAGRQRFRIEKIGLVFQEFELLDYLTVRENVLLPYRISSAIQDRGQARERAEQLLDSTGIGALAERLPGEISQGERQRVALCRALVTQPGLILADEPTGSLDPENQARSVALLREKAAEAGAPLVMVTHDHEVISGFDRVIQLPDLLAKAGKEGDA